MVSWADETWGSEHSRKSAWDIMAQNTDTWCTRVCVCVFVRSLQLSLERLAAAEKYFTEKIMLHPLVCLGKHKHSHSYYSGFVLLEIHRVT